MAEVFWGNIWDDDFDLEKGGKSNPKLIPMKKQVIKDGKPFMQTFWVMPDEIQGNDQQVHSDLKEHLRHVRKTLGADKYKKMLQKNGVNWNSHATDKIDTMNATSAAIEHLKGGGTLTHEGENGEDEHVITGKHQSQHAQDEHKQDNQNKPYHVWNAKTKQFDPVNNAVPVSIDPDIESFLYQLKDGKFVVSEAHSGMALASNSGNGYDTKEEAIGAAKKKLSALGVDNLKASIKGAVKMNGISPSHSHNYDDVMGNKKDNQQSHPQAQPKPTVQSKPKATPKPKDDDDEDFAKPNMGNMGDAMLNQVSNGKVTTSIKDMNGEDCKVGDIVKDTNGKNFIITEIKDDGTVWGKRIGKGKEDAKPKIIKNQFKKFTPKKGTPVVPTKKPAAAPKPTPKATSKLTHDSLGLDPDKYNALFEQMDDDVREAGGSEEFAKKILDAMKADDFDKAKKLVQGMKESDLDDGVEEDLDDVKDEIEAGVKSVEKEVKKLKEKKTQEDEKFKKLQEAAKKTVKKPAAKPTVKAKAKSDVTQAEMSDLKTNLGKIQGLPKDNLKELLDQISDKGFGMHTKDLVENWEKKGLIDHSTSFTIGGIVANMAKDHASFLANQKLGKLAHKQASQAHNPDKMTPAQSQLVQNYLSAWYGSSGHPKSVALRFMLAQTLSHPETMEQTFIYIEKRYQISRKEAEGYIKDYATPEATEAFKALYNENQAYFHKLIQDGKIPKTITLFRGVGIKEAHEALKNNGTAVYKHNPTDSWSANPGVADNFGDGSHQIVMKIEVPIEHILTNHVFNHSGFPEKEWFILPQETDLKLELGKNVWIKGGADVPYNVKQEASQNNNPFYMHITEHKNNVDWSTPSPKGNPIGKDAASSASAKPTVKASGSGGDAPTPIKKTAAGKKAHTAAKKIIKEVLKTHGKYDHDAHPLENLEGTSKDYGEKYDKMVHAIANSPDFEKQASKELGKHQALLDDSDYVEHAENMLQSELDQWNGKEHHLAGTAKKSLIMVPLNRRN